LILIFAGLRVKGTKNAEHLQRERVDRKGREVKTEKITDKTGGPRRSAKILYFTEGRKKNGRCIESTKKRVHGDEGRCKQKRIKGKACQ